MMLHMVFYRITSLYRKMIKMKYLDSQNNKIHLNKHIQKWYYMQEKMGVVEENSNKRGEYL